MEQKLREYRELKGYTLRQVEECTNISNAYLSQLETGKIKKPSAQTIYTLSKLYNVPLETLLIESGLVEQVNIGEPAIIQKGIGFRIVELETRVKKLEDFLSLQQNIG